ncbi:MAG: hypothetical protein IKZ48_07145 [Prevotella sp.]|nr:hypothetical protein [Prevotella sp.]
MASIDDELLMDEEETRREMAFIRKQLPQDMKEKYSDKQLLWMLDEIVEYYVSSGVLDTNDEEIDIDMEKVAAYVCEQSLKQGQGELDPQEVSFVVEADLDFQEQA